MTSPPDPNRAWEHPSLENSPSSADPYAPVDYPADYPPPPAYPPPGPAGYPGPTGYPGPVGGYPMTDPYDPYRAAMPPGTNGMAIGALVASLVGLLFCGVPSIVGLVLGIIAMRQTRRTGEQGWGMALAGTIIGGLMTAFWVIYLLIVIVVVVSDFQWAP